MPNLPDTLCYLDGNYTPLNQAKVSVLDRGFLFGDGVYEVVPVYGRGLFRFEEHMARLERSLAKVRIANPHTAAEWLARCRRLIESHVAEDQLIYVQVTRGVGPRDHVMPTDIEPTVFIMVSALKQPSAEQRHRGVACVTARDFRWERGDIKSISLLGNVLARQISADHGAVETILLGPPASEHVLEGVRYELIRELCDDVGIAFNLRPIPEGEVVAADELMLSSASKEVLPVTMLDGESVGHGVGRGKPGPVYAKLYAAYQRAKAAQRL